VRIGAPSDLGTKLESAAIGVEPDTADFLSGRSFVANVVLNLSAEFITICLGLVCVPYVVRRLGADSFGILSLSWILLFYMSLFDLGLSRATTKFAAEAIGSGDRGQLPSLLGASLSLQSAIGLISGSLLFILSPWVVGLLKIPGNLLIQATLSFRILAFAVPVVLITNCLRGMLEALQRFDLVNYVKVPTNASMFLAPILVLPFGGLLPSIILLMTAFRCAAMLAYLLSCLSVLPKPGLRFGYERHISSQLLKYGGWITVSNATGPILMYADRFMIGILVSIGSVAYYTAPADMINRALIVPASMGAILFPAFSSLAAAGAKEKMEDFYARSIKFLIMGLGPVLLLVNVFSRNILQLWLGGAFAEKSALPLQILTVGTFINSLGFFPYSLLQGMGKPKITAVFHVVEIPLHVALVWILVARMGIVGAAIASTMRVLIDTTLLFWACSWMRLTSFQTLLKQGTLRSLVSLVAFGVALYIGAGVVEPLPVRIGIALVLLVCYVLAEWRWIIDSRDRLFLNEIKSGILVRLGGPRVADPREQSLPGEVQ
jgi:O-antigen/teichoic acid export membrane protein